LSDAKSLSGCVVMFFLLIETEYDLKTNPAPNGLR